MVMLSETRTESGTMILNMGPQHPSTHGVLRLLIERFPRMRLAGEPARIVPFNLWGRATMPVAWD